MIVVDASAVIELLLNTALAETIAQRVLRIEQSIHAPELLDIEVAQVLRRLERARIIDSSRAVEALSDLADLPVVRHGHQPLLDEIWSLRHNATAYDATYLALTKALDAVLLTCDAALASVPGYSRRVEVVS